MSTPADPVGTGPGAGVRADPPTIELGIAGLIEPVEIGRGGAGVVYRARQPGLNRVVGVKVLSAVLDQVGRERFEREAYAMGTVAGHPNIVQVLTTGTTDFRRPYLVMPYVAGGSLADRLPLPWQQAISYIIRISGALETAHRAGVLHRDVKPSNVLISAFGEPLLADFGIARVAGGFETSEGLVSASIPYAAPEVLSGKPASPAADVYSLATTLYCAITGRPPFAAESDEALVALYIRITRDPIPDLRSWGVPDPVCRVIEQGVAKDPDDRPVSAADFGRLLQRAQHDVGEPITPMAITEEVDRTTTGARPMAPARGAAVVGPVVHGVVTGSVGPGGPALDGFQPGPLAGVPMGGLTAVQPIALTSVQPASRLDGTAAVAGRRLRGRWGWIALVAAVVLVIGGVTAGILLGPRKSAPPPPVPGKPAAALELKGLADMRLGPDGSVYLADPDDNVVKRVTAGGVVEIVAGTGTSGDKGDGRPAETAELDRPQDLALAPDGTLYIATGGQIRKIDPAGLIRPVTGFTQTVDPAAMAVGADGTLFLARGKDITSRTLDGRVTTYATGFDDVQGLLPQSDGSMLVADAGTDLIYRLAPLAASRTVIAGTTNENAKPTDALAADATKLSDPRGLAVDAQGRVYFSETGTNRIRRIQEDDTVLTMAGNPDDWSSGNEGDGAEAIDATFNLGGGAIFVDSAGSIYIADGGNKRIRVVSPTGIVTAWG